MLGNIRNWWMLELLKLCHCVQHPWKLTGRDFWCSRNDRKTHFSAKICFEKMLWGISEMVIARAFKLCHCVQHPWKLTGRDFWSSRNDRKPLSQQKCVLRKCFRESQKWWVLELSNLCHCVQHPWKLTSKDFWSSQNKRKPLSQQKCVLRKCCGVSQKLWMSEHFVIVFSTLENLLVGISGAPGMTVIHFLSKNLFWENAVGNLRYGDG